VNGLPPLGLVEQVTTRTLPHMSEAVAIRELNRERRIRRMRRVVIASADATRALRGFRVKGILVTLTYRDSSPWRSEDVTRYVNCVRQWLRRRGVRCRYQWVLELTKRGRPHYHVLFWVPQGTKLPKPDSSGQWVNGLSNIAAARRPVGYLVKYATKGGLDGELLPRGARLFGCGAAEDCVRLARHRAGLPAWLNEAASPCSRVVRVVRVGWVEADTGAIHRTPYEVLFLRNDLGFVVVVVCRKQEVTL